MAQPVLWGSPIALPADILMPQVTALRNGTFLVIGKIGTPGNYLPKAWIYDADGSLKHERLIEIPDAGDQAPEMNLDLSAVDPMAVELPDGRIALTWTSDLNGYMRPWLGLYSGDLVPLDKPAPIKPADSGTEDFDRADAVTSLGNGNLAISYWHESSGKVFLRTFGPGGSRRRWSLRRHNSSLVRPSPT